MRFLKALGMTVIRWTMPVVPLCPMLPARSELLFALLLTTYLAAEILAPITFQIVRAALSSVPLCFAVAISRIAPQSDENVPRLFPLLASLAPRPPPVF
jgi:hypothetical protein